MMNHSKRHKELESMIHDMKGVQVHEVYLERLVHNLRMIDEDPIAMRFLIKDIRIYRPDSYCMQQGCDLVLGYDGYVNLAELKGSFHKQAKARSQMQSTAQMIQDLWGIEVRSRKVVVYRSPGKYDFRVI